SYCESAQGTDIETLAEMNELVQRHKEISPRNHLRAPFQMQMASVTSTHKQLVDAHLRGNFLEGLLGVRDRQRHQDGSRPRRDFVQIEPEPVGKQHQLRRNRRYRLPVILTQEA